MVEPTGAVDCGDGAESIVERLDKGASSSCFGHPKERLHLAPSFLDRIELGGVGWEKFNACAALADQRRHFGALMKADDIPNDDVTSAKRGCEFLLDPCQE